MAKVKILNVEYIKQILEERNMTVADLAQAIGYSVKTVKKYLNGADQKNLSVKLPYRIAVTLKTSLESLLYEEEIRVYSK